jgi:Ca2+-binding RTX toxin-like protein
LLIAQATTGDNDNIVIGNSDDNTIAGNEGGVPLTGDLRYPGNGNDRLFGESGNDEIRGKAGDDILSGGPDNDRLFGDGSINPLASSGNDILFGGAGQDELTGGGGADTFVFAPGDGGSSAEQADLITDFELETDQIGLIDLTFEQLSFQAVSDTSSAIVTGDEFLASLDGVGVEEIQNPDFFVPIDESIFQVS